MSPQKTIPRPHGVSAGRVGASRLPVKTLQYVYLDVSASRSRPTAMLGCTPTPTPHCPRRSKTPAQVSQSYGAFNHILGDLSLIVNQFESLSAFSAGVDRLGEFLERMKGGESGDCCASAFLSFLFCTTLSGTARTLVGHGSHFRYPADPQSVLRCGPKSLSKNGTVVLKGFKFRTERCASSCF